MISFAIEEKYLLAQRLNIFLVCGSVRLIAMILVTRQPKKQYPEIGYNISEAYTYRLVHLYLRLEEEFWRRVC